jgi:membrane-associated phospholipid phosphatase
MRSLIRLVVVVVAFSAMPAAAQVVDEPAQDEPRQDEPKQDEPKKDPAPPPPHGSTGWASLIKDSAGDFVAFPRRHSTWVLLGIGAGAALATHPEDHYVETHIVGNATANRVFSPGQWIGSAYVQVGSAVGLWAVGRYVVAPAADGPKTNKYSELGFDLIRAQILSQALVHGMKYSIRRDRPTGECCAFPSGHAASAFAAASVLERHFGYRGSWPAMAAATYVATSRLVDNRHFLSDVAFGAAVGMSSGWTVVGTRGRSHLALEPVPVRGGMMIALSRVD